MFHLLTQITWYVFCQLLFIQHHAFKYFLTQKKYICIYLYSVSFVLLFHVSIPNGMLGMLFVITVEY